MSMPRRESIYVVALAAGLLGGAGAAYAGGLSLSVSVPGASVAAGPGGVAVGVAQPGFYGELSVGNLPAPPPVIYTQPVIVTAAPEYVGSPIYLHVPPGYERHWAEHCAEYHACARRVYFVRDNWYNTVYVPRYRHVDREHYRDHDNYRDHDAYRDHVDRDDRGRGEHHGRDDHDRGEHHGRDDHDRGEHHGRDDHDRGDLHDHD
jgi:hypothetical protein